MTDLHTYVEAYGNKHFGPLTMYKAELAAIKERAEMGIHSPDDIKVLLAEVDILQRACWHYATQMGRWQQRFKTEERRGRPRSVKPT